jgi:hydroxymethylbilane synthase
MGNAQAPVRVRVGTRGSALALKQTDIAIAALSAAAASEGTRAEFDIVRISTKGDAAQDKSFEAIGPKGIFAAELQRALLDGAVDVAVHSLKDLPSEEPEGLVLAAILKRDDARDVLVSREGKTLALLHAGSVVGTSSARRRAQLAIHRPDLHHAPLRGNVDTRLRKVKDGEVDAAILAGAGLVRLGRSDEVSEFLDPLRFVPPPGQGAIVVEARADRVDGDLWWVRGADHAPSHGVVRAERTFMRLIEGGCEVPLGAWARFEGSDIVCDGFLSLPDGSRYMIDRTRGSDPSEVGAELARRMLRAGAGALTRPGS